LCLYTLVAFVYICVASLLFICFKHKFLFPPYPLSLLHIQSWSNPLYAYFHWCSLFSCSQFDGFSLPLWSPLFNIFLLHVLFFSSDFITLPSLYVCLYRYEIMSHKGKNTIIVNGTVD
jgi:hypothetical protein